MENNSLEEQLLSVLWTSFKIALNVIGFLILRMLSVVFASSIRKWYRKNDFPVNTEEKSENSMLADPLENFRHEDEGKQNRTTEKTATYPNVQNKKTSGPEPEESGGEESFIQSANKFLDRIKLRKEERNKQLEKVKANLQESMKQKMSSTQ